MAGKCRCRALFCAKVRALASRADSSRAASAAINRACSSADSHRTRSLASSSISTWSTPASGRSEEHTSELQSLMRISYAVFCLKKKKKKKEHTETEHDKHKERG